MSARDDERGGLRLTSPEFAHGEPIPKRHTCEGENISPGLAWSGVPVETRSFALICDDPDAPRGTWLHWTLYNLPAEAIELGPAVPAKPELPAGARQGITDFGKVGYGGPCPPPGKPHRYFFRLYALGAALNLPPGVHRSELEAAIKEHVLAMGTLMGTYERKGV
jgi:Raf kinase inhibitor-like YbhB/YbcL family protein